MNLDRIDARILALLLQDGRRSVVELAEEISLSATACARRIRLMEQARVIEGYSALVNPAGLGLKVQAFIQVKLQQHADDIVATFQSELAKIEEVIACFATTGESDFLLQVMVPDLEALSSVVLKQLLKIAGVRDVRSSIVLETIKRSARMPLTHLPEPL
jgi:Lrp/AsnC family transcriptional regulator, leucine-responsive regulatory protein